MKLTIYNFIYINLIIKINLMKRTKKIKSTTVCSKRRRYNAPSTSGYIVRNMVRNYEIKTIDTTNATSVGGYSNYFATIDSLAVTTNLVVSGSAYNQRVGNKIKLKSIRVNAYVHPTDVTNATRNMITPVRFMIIYDRQCNGTTLSNTGFFEKPTHTLGFMDPAYQDRYKIIADDTKLIVWLPIYNSTNDNSGIYYKVFRKFNKPLDTLFGASTGSMSDIQTGALFFVVFTESPNTGTGSNIFDCRFNIRVRYYDF